MLNRKRAIRHTGSGEGAWDKVRSFKENLKKVTRHFPELNPSESPFHAMAMDLLLDYERAPEWAARVAQPDCRVREGPGPDELDSSRARWSCQTSCSTTKGLCDGRPG